jgi:hypothetical protein
MAAIPFVKKVKEVPPFVERNVCEAVKAQNTPSPKVTPRN